jgi:hypothetical protein
VSRPQSLQGLPILTEVIDLLPSVQSVSAEVGVVPAQAPSGAAADTPVDEPAAISEEAVVQRVLADMQRHSDLVLEQRLREALMPALARLSDALVLDLRQEFAKALPELVAHAVSLELARRRGEGPASRH